MYIRFPRTWWRGRGRCRSRGGRGTRKRGFRSGRSSRRSRRRRRDVVARDADRHEPAVAVRHPGQSLHSGDRPRRPGRPVVEGVEGVVVPDGDERPPPERDVLEGNIDGADRSPRGPVGDVVARRAEETVGPGDRQGGEIPGGRHRQERVVAERQRGDVPGEVPGRPGDPGDSVGRGEELARGPSRKNDPVALREVVQDPGRGNRDWPRRSMSAGRGWTGRPPCRS